MKDIWIVIRLQLPEATTLLYSPKGELFCQVFNRSGVAGAVLQTASLLIKVSHGLWKYIQSTINPKTEELES